MDHLKLDIINDLPGPWIHLFAPFNKEYNGRDPVNIAYMEMDYDAKEYVPYSGPLPESDEYKTAAEAFKGCLSDRASQ
jgi:hypothetical protein